MTQETLDKLHIFERNLHIWNEFKTNLESRNNIAILQAEFPYYAITELNERKFEGWNDFKEYVLKYAEDKINYYTKEIRNL